MDPVAETKQFRKDLDDQLKKLSASTRKSRNRSLAITHLEDCIMRLGKDLQELGTPDPYPESRNPASPRIEPTAI